MFFLSNYVFFSNSLSRGVSLIENRRNIWGPRGRLGSTGELLRLNREAPSSLALDIYLSLSFPLRVWYTFTFSFYMLNLTRHLRTLTILSRPVSLSVCSFFFFFTVLSLSLLRVRTPLATYSHKLVSSLFFYLYTCTYVFFFIRSCWCAWHGEKVWQEMCPGDKTHTKERDSLLV